MSPLLLATLWLGSGPTPKVDAGVAKEMSSALVALDKALGLQSWPSHGVKPCVDQGDAANLTKKVTVEETKKCATAAVKDGFPGLGKSYVVAVLMSEVGPSTVVAFGLAEHAAFAARFCDPGKPCPPMRLDPQNKWGKRLLDRRTQACSQPTTVWLPVDKRACPTP